MEMQAKSSYLLGLAQPQLQLQANLSRNKIGCSDNCSSSTSPSFMKVVTRPAPPKSQMSLPRSFFILFTVASTFLLINVVFLSFTSLKVVEKTYHFLLSK